VANATAGGAVAPNEKNISHVDDSKLGAVQSRVPQNNQSKGVYRFHEGAETTTISQKGSETTGG
jgi:hypothetical protein